ncbi:MAG: LPS export ABC transporter periplasmic protein LptC [Mariprofundaceae bacterium]|nr:LPS export ABC transporter periplasmic protein LptC [Mariprofundaceae bacterium]
MSKTLSSLLKWIFLAISLISLLVAGVLMWLEGQSNTHVSQTSKTEATSTHEAGTQVESPWMVERKGDHVLWRLKANHAEENLTNVHFTQPFLELFNKKNEKMTIKAQQATLNTLSRNVHFQGNVVVHFQTWTLLSDTLDAENSSGDILVPQHFIAHNPTSSIKGRGLRIHHESHEMWIQHDVWMRQHTSVDKP